MKKMFKIVAVGCCHGKLDIIYDSIQQSYGADVDAVLISGDFEAMRNEQDLNCMACPEKYRSMEDFSGYYHGHKQAPYLTIVVGGNHEASNYFYELRYGGWLAPNIYFLGDAGVVNIGPGLRIAGLSGIYDPSHYKLGRFEKPPYNIKTIRSTYHIRESDVRKLSLLQGKRLNVFMSHDWPTGITKYGNEAQLLKRKPFFRQDINSGRLGSVPARQLLSDLRPAHWFSAHLHVRFTAEVKHVQESHNPDEIDLDDDFESPEEPADDLPKITRFLALDKPLPKRRFMEMVKIETDVPSKRSFDQVSANELSNSEETQAGQENNSKVQLYYDPDWLAITRVFNNNSDTSISDLDEKFKQELEWVNKNICTDKDKLRIPINFRANVPELDKTNPDFDRLRRMQPKLVDNEQTIEFLRLVGVS